MRRLFVILSVVVLALATAVPVAAANQRGGNGNSPIVGDHVWVDGETYDTILLGSLPWSEQNAHSFNTIYPVFLPDMTEAQGPVTEYAPGDPEYRGGRWVPEPAFWTEAAVTYFGGVGNLPLIEDVDELHALEAAGWITSPGEQPQLAFECPLLPNH